MKLKEYQRQLVSELQRIYPITPIHAEWTAIRKDRSVYCPRIDVAVGPFATDTKCFIDEYDTLFANSEHFISTMLDYHKQNVERLSWENFITSIDSLRNKNRNARCLLAIEIENRVSRKHLIGGAVNAAALGRIGIVVAWTPEKLKAFVKLRRYLNFLGSVGKNTFDTTNLLILDRDQLLQSIRDSYTTSQHALKL